MTEPDGQMLKNHYYLLTRLDKLENKHDTHSHPGLAEVLTRLDKLEATVKDEEGTPWAHLNLTYRLNAAEEATRSNTRAINALTATVSSLQRQLTDTRHKVASHAGDGYGHAHPPQPESTQPWKWGNLAHEGILSGGNLIYVSGLGGPISAHEWETMCRSYLRHRGEDV